MQERNKIAWGLMMVNHDSNTLVRRVLRITIDRRQRPVDYARHVEPSKPDVSKHSMAYSSTAVAAY